MSQVKGRKVPIFTIPAALQVGRGPMDECRNLGTRKGARNGDFRVVSCRSCRGRHRKENGRFLIIGKSPLRAPYCRHETISRNSARWSPPTGLPGGYWYRKRTDQHYASVASIVVCVPPIVYPLCQSVSRNAIKKLPFIVVSGHHHCELLHPTATETHSS